jgi:hypothetical protein
MTATTRDETEFLAAIARDPDSDMPRLAYADFLQETAGTVPCPRCSEHRDDPASPPRAEPGYHPERDPASGRHEGGWTNCKTCNGGGPRCISPGTVPDDRADRAEFIRVQCELARVSGTQDPDCRRAKKNNPRGDAHSYVDVQSNKPAPCCDCWASLRVRERALRAANPRWSRCECPACGGKGRVRPNEFRDGWRWNAGDICPTCGGSGDLFQRRHDGPSSAFAEPRTLDFCCYPLLGVGCRREELWEYERTCEIRESAMHGRLHQVRTVIAPWARKVTEVCPLVTRLMISDAEPTGPIAGGPDVGFWFWVRRDFPAELWLLIQAEMNRHAERHESASGGCVTSAAVPTRAAALDACHTAAARFARGRS